MEGTTANDETFRVLTVCSANICRSPASARALSELIASSGLTVPVEVTSAGVEALVGEPRCTVADEALTQELAGLGIARAAAPDDLGLAVPLTLELIAQADLVLTATRRHSAAVVKLAPAARTKVQTWRQAAAGSDWLRSEAGSLSVAHDAELIASLPGDDLRSGTPVLPAATLERLRWWVAELDAARGIAGHAIDRSHPEVDPADIPDPHMDKPYDHAYPAKLTAIATAGVLNAMAAVATAPSGD